VTVPGSTRRPLVSVVTPFYDSAPYLRACIESVLAQTYGNFEYLLVDNLSTDEGHAIAEEYAARDPRVRLFRNAAHVPQTPNYNGALRQVSPGAAYVKVVSADDLILPECLDRMVAAGEAHPSAAIVAAYYVAGRNVKGGGLPLSASLVSGREVCRMHLLEGRYLFGSPSTVLYRADVVRGRDPFYAEDSRQPDTEACYDLLEHADLAFVHQVLSYASVRDDSIQSSLAAYNWDLLGLYLLLRKYGPRLLSSDELSRATAAAHAEYLRYLGESRLVGRERQFWEEHRRALESVGQPLPTLGELAPHMLALIARAALHPVSAMRRMRSLKPRPVRQVEQS
jgi:glycosyltransferase involved in cell wall biosynthesis